MSQNRPDGALPHVENLRIAIATAQWNAEITHTLRDGAVKRLKEYGLTDNDIALFDVPGAIELTFAASQLIEASMFDAIIVFGCVVRGDTPHFDYVCQSVTQGITQLNADVDTPVIFGVLTVENMDQARDRVGGPAGHKGIEAAETAIHMAHFKQLVQDL